MTNMLSSAVSQSASTGAPTGNSTFGAHIPSVPVSGSAGSTLSGGGMSMGLDAMPSHYSSTRIDYPSSVSGSGAVGVGSSSLSAMSALNSSSLSRDQSGSTGIPHGYDLGLSGPPMPPVSTQQQSSLSYFGMPPAVSRDSSSISGAISKQPLWMTDSSALGSGSYGGSNGYIGGLSGDDSLFDLHDEPKESFIDGALELSAGAKPFVPRFGSTAAATASPVSATLSPPPPPSLNTPFSVSSTLGSGLGGLGLGAPGLSNSPWGGVPMSLDGKASVGGESKLSSFLSNLLPSDLNLDEDNFEYGDASNIIPDLDSFLLNDN